ncbi:FUSC family protein, partial [Serratia quinivorans]
MRNGPQAQQAMAAGELSEIAAELKTLMQEASASQHGEAPIYGYVWLSMELTQQLEELGDLLKACTAGERE